MQFIEGIFGGGELVRLCGLSIRKEKGVAQKRKSADLKSLEVGISASTMMLNINFES